MSKSFQPDIHLEISSNTHKEADSSTTLPWIRKLLSSSQMPNISMAITWEEKTK